MIFTRSEVIEALDSELSATPQRLEFEVLELEREGQFWKVFVDLSRTRQGALDESLEGAVAIWAKPERGAADVLSVVPEHQQINLRLATSSPPSAGGRISVLRPPYLQSVRGVWADDDWAVQCERWWDRLVADRPKGGGQALDPSPFRKLRPRQRDAFGLTRFDVSFLWGPPGTGKTTTLGALLARLVSGKGGSRILLLSTTNAAVDQALVAVDRALEELGRKEPAATAAREACLRVGSHYVPSYYVGREHLLPVKSPTLIRELTALEARRPEPGQVRAYAQWKESVQKLRSLMGEQAKDAFRRARLVAATTTRAAFSVRDLKGLVPYDLVAFDEASQVSLAHALALTPLGKRVLFAGDPKQLPPIVRAETDRAKEWIGRSVFDVARLNSPWTVTLDEQSRMASPICSVVSNVFYDGTLKVAVDCVKSKAWHKERQPKSLSRLGSAHAGVWEVPEAGTWSAKYGGFIRFCSAKAVAGLVSELLTHLQPNDILVLTPFRAQRTLVRQLLRSEGPSARRVGVSTVHRAQGRECHTVLFDPVVGASEFLTNAEAGRLVNVALSRAKARLVVLLSQADRENPLLDQVANLIRPPGLGLPEEPIRKFALDPKFPHCLSGRVVRLAEIVGYVDKVMEEGRSFSMIDHVTGKRRTFSNEVVLKRFGQALNGRRR